MTTKLQIDSGIQNDLEICFTVVGTSKTVDLTPAGKMITDSKEMTFVYLLDEEEEYGYIHFPQSVWPLMVAVLKGNKDPVIIHNDVRITLIGFVDELTMLIFNIEGNDNYGEEFTTVVEQAFTEILTSSE